MTMGITSLLETKFRGTFWKSLITLKMVPLDFERTDSGKEEQ